MESTRVHAVLDSVEDKESVEIENLHNISRSWKEKERDRRGLKELNEGNEIRITKRNEKTRNEDLKKIQKEDRKRELEREKERGIQRGKMKERLKKLQDEEGDKSEEDIKEESDDDDGHGRYYWTGGRIIRIHMDDK